jgi:DNA polymerase I-like protein with 3'-5' exonuclease and polymerase domains
MFTPDPGYTLCASDLDRADLQVVAWDSNCEALKTLLKEELDVHLYNVGVYFKKDITFDQLRDPARVRELMKLYGDLRNTKAKAAQHALNYLVHPKTLSTILGVSISEAGEIRNKHFSLYHEIAEWHQKIWLDLLRENRVRNAFGYHIIHFGRLSENYLKNYVAWVPQSTVAIVINKCWAQLEEMVSEAVVLLQVHDELIYQIPTAKLRHLKPRIREAFSVRIPYPDPLFIPAGLKTSTISWGDAKEESWEEQ